MPLPLPSRATRYIPIVFKSIVFIICWFIVFYGKIILYFQTEDDLNKDETYVST